MLKLQTISKDFQPRFDTTCIGFRQENYLNDTVNSTKYYTEQYLIKSIGYFAGEIEEIIFGVSYSSYQD